MRSTRCWWCFAATRAGNVADVYAAIAEAAETGQDPDRGQLPRRTQGGPQVDAGRRSEAAGVPVPESAIRALGHAVRYAEWRERPQGVVPDLDRVDAERARDVVRRFLDSHPDGDWLDPEPASELLGTVGIAVQPSVQATSQHQALEAADGAGIRWH